MEEETRIVALLGRGDTHEEIQQNMEADYRPVSRNTIIRVKKRNGPNLQIIKTRFLEKHEADALAIRQKANLIINKRLSMTERVSDLVAKAQKQYMEGEMTSDEYVEILKANREATMNELVGVSREMHNQAKEEEAPAGDQKDIAALVEAIRSGDEVTLNQIVFKGDNDKRVTPPA